MRIPGGYAVLGSVLETLLKHVFSSKSANGGEFARQLKEIHQKLADAITAVGQEQDHVRYAAEKAQKTADDLSTKLHEADRTVTVLSSKFHLWMWISGAIHLLSLALIVYGLARL